MLKQIAITTCEIDEDLETALRIGTELGIRNYELRSVWGKRTPRFSEEETTKLLTLISQYDVKVVAISPSVFRNKYSEDEVAESLEILNRAFDLAESLQCHKIVVFSFRRSENEAPDFILDKAVNVLRNAADRAKERGMDLVHEPMPELYGNTSVNLFKLIKSIDHPCFNVNWDAPNLCKAKDEQIFPYGYNLLKPYIKHIHLKNWMPKEDWTTLDRGILNWKDILSTLKRDGYNGYLTIETHHGPLVEKSKKNYDWLKNMIPNL
jgi:sugar phosphate isomerase/epimerase